MSGVGLKSLVNGPRGLGSDLDGGVQIFKNSGIKITNHGLNAHFVY
jgi:hypothetical protein